MKRIVCMAMIGVTLTVTAARADVTYSPTIYGASDSAGTNIVDGTYLLILDLTGNGWNGHSYAAQAPAGADNSSAWLWDSSDLLLQKGVIGDLSDPNAFAGDITDAFRTVAAGTPGFSATVSHCYLLWFPVNKAAASPGRGAQYGVFDVGVAAHDGDTLSPILDGFASPGSTNTTFTTVANNSPWFNATLAFDVNGDGQMTSADALGVINKLNADGGHALQQPGDPLPTPGVGLYWDVNNDGYVSPIDALQIINGLNSVGGSAPFVLGSGPNGLTLTQVPEPATALLLLAGGGLLSFGHRRRFNVK